MIFVVFEFYFGCRPDEQSVCPLDNDINNGSRHQIKTMANDNGLLR